MTRREEPHVWTNGAAPPGVPRISVAWISRPRSGETESGDAVVVREHGAGVLVAVVDALGHGPRAAEVARQSTEWLRDATHPESGAMMLGLHDALRGSRGAAALLLMMSSRGVDACSVGNVELRSSTGKLPFVLTPGVLGLRLRAPKTCFSGTRTSERLVAFSDGISGRFDFKHEHAKTPTDLALHLFGHHRHSHDDATIVVIDVAF